VNTRLSLFKVYIKPHVDYAIEMWQMPLLNKKFEKRICPLYFSSLKRTLHIANNVNNYRALLALGLWHPVYTSMLKFIISAINIMK
jgi:hypothetical protein